MDVITNRNLRPRQAGLDVFDDGPNRRKGPKELRVVRCEPDGDDWRCEILPDTVTGPRRVALKEILQIPASDPGPLYASLDVAERVRSAASAAGRSVVLVVHGYNTDIRQTLKTAQDLEAHFGVVPLVFSWPSNGGGLRGLASYLSDKQDAQVSVPAFARLLEKVSQLANRFTRLALQSIQPELDNVALAHPPASAEYQRERNRLLNERCGVRQTLLCHSMGNYLLKKTMETSANTVFTNAFDNVVLASADVNNLDHAFWVDQIESRRRTYITINEDDFALAASRIKPGDRQLARLGHYLKRLDARTARYVDFTDTEGVGNSHSYFTGHALDNAGVKRFWQAALNGREAESVLEFHESERVYRIPGGRAR